MPHFLPSDHQGLIHYQALEEHWSPATLEKKQRDKETEVDGWLDQHLDQRLDQRLCKWGVKNGITLDLPRPLFQFRARDAAIQNTKRKTQWSKNWGMRLLQHAVVLCASY